MFEEGLFLLLSTRFLFVRISQPGFRIVSAVPLPTVVPHDALVLFSLWLGLIGFFCWLVWLLRPYLGLSFFILFFSLCSLSFLPINSIPLLSVIDLVILMSSPFKRLFPEGQFRPSLGWFFIGCDVGLGPGIFGGPGGL